MAATAALSKWAHARVQTFALPSGAGEVDVDMLDLSEALAYGRIPNPLRPAAIKAETGVVTEAELPEDDEEEGSEDANRPLTRKQWFAFRCWVVADGVKEFRPTKGEKIVGPLDPEWVATEMPPSDRDEIWATRMHLISTDVAKKLLTLLDLDKFRSLPGSDDASGGGESNGQGTKPGGAD